MAKSLVYKREHEEIPINMTPMIDIVFQLIIFFILASQFASKEISAVTLPFPVKPPSVEEKDLKGVARVVINVLSKEDPEHAQSAGGQPQAYGELLRYEINREPFDEFLLGERISAETGKRMHMAEVIKNKFEDAQQKGLPFFVEIRADYRVAYEHVARALSAAGSAGVKKVYITVRRNPIPEEMGRET